MKNLRQKIGLNVVRALALIMVMVLVSGCSFGAKKYDLPSDNAEVMRLARTTDDADLLDYLSTYENSGVRAYVAKNPATRDETLYDILKNEDNIDVLNYLAANKEAPADILEQLAKSENEMIRHAVAKNPSTPLETLKGFVGDTYNVQKMLTENESLTEEIMLKIIDESSPEVVILLLNRDSLPASVLGALKNYDDATVKEYAEKFDGEVK